MPHLFEHVCWADSARDNGGFGPGLVISHSIVQAHGGSISVDSQPERGATFTVTFPATTATGKR